MNQALDNYLAALSADWHDSLDTESTWERAAREAVEHALENAEWDDATKTIALSDPDDDRMGTTVASSEELWNALEEIARSAWHGSVPYDGGEPVYECDEYGIVEGVWSDYEEKITKFFAPDEEPDTPE